MVNDMEATAPHPPMPALDKVPPLPGAVLELLRSLDDEDINTAALAKKIGQDPLLSARVLKIVNSPFYGVTGLVASLPEAVMVLGFSNLRSLAMAASLTAGFPMHGQGDADPRRLWRHSFCCALCAQALAQTAKVDAGQAFTAGLLHDIGRIALLAAFPERFAAVLETSRQQGIGFDAAEQATLGFSHAAFGARLLERWRLPAMLAHAVEFHHAPDTEPTRRLTDLVCAADIFAHGIVRGDLEQMISSTDPNGAFIRIGLTRAQCPGLLSKVPEQLEALAATLH
jgi:putative nucleotidyltransferase with HDIG domain